MRPVMEAKSRKSRDPAPGSREAGQPAESRRFPHLFTKRSLLHLWLPAALFAVLAVIAFNWSTIRSETLSRFEVARSAVIDHPEFAVTDLEISGHIQKSVHEIGKIAGIEPGTEAISSLRFDARKARDALIADPWIERASVAIDPSGIMKIVIVERIPVAIWRNDDGFFLIDHAGRKIVPVEGADARLDLPLLIGADANEAVSDAHALLKGAPVSALPRIAALVRRGGRRWDVITTGGLVLKLPAADPLDALRRFADERLEQRVSPHAVTGIDLRLPNDPPVIRLEPGAREMREELLKALRTTYR